MKEIGTKKTVELSTNLGGSSLRRQTKLADCQSNQSTIKKRGLKLTESEINQETRSQKMLGIKMEYFKYLYFTKLEKLKYINEFLDSDITPKVNQIANNLKGYITNQTEIVIQSFCMVR